MWLKAILFSGSSAHSVTNVCGVHCDYLATVLRYLVTKDSDSDSSDDEGDSSKWAVKAEAIDIYDPMDATTAYSQL